MIGQPTSLHALVTCCGGMGGINTVQSLRLSRYDQLFVLGVDADPRAAKVSNADAFEHVPYPSDPSFLTRVQGLMRDYQIDIIYPLAAGELLTLINYRDRLSCIVPGGNLASVEIADDKGRLYDYLRERGVDVPRSLLCSSVNELEAGVEQLGYPERKLVIKPRKASGCRGFHILDAEVDSTRAFVTERPGYARVRWEDVRSFLADPLPELVLMDFLEGVDYTCYALVDRGQPCCVLPLRRSGLIPGMSLGGTIECNETVIEYVSDICRVFGFHGFVNIQLMLVKGRPRVYEINPRISATTVACTAAGVNIPVLLFELFSEGEVVVPEIVWNTRFERVYQELVYPPGIDHALSLSQAVQYGRGEAIPQNDP